MIPLHWDPGSDAPAVMAELAPREPIHFLVDTGAAGEGWLAFLDARILVRRGELWEVGSALAASISGVTKSRQLQAKRLELGGFEVKQPVLGEALRGSVLGLRFWSRYVVTLDFPERKLYLRKGRQFDWVEPPNLSGLLVWPEGTSLVVKEVEPGSPAARAGLQKGDVLVEINGRKRAQTPLREFVEPLRGTDRVACVYLRGAQEHRTTLNLAWSITADRVSFKLRFVPVRFFPAPFFPVPFLPLLSAP